MLARVVAGAPRDNSCADEDPGYGPHALKLTTAIDHGKFQSLIQSRQAAAVDFDVDVVVVVVVDLDGNGNGNVVVSL